MITYNQVDYLSDAIEGVLMQECDFDIELLIADDCSTDSTAELVNKYIERHPKGNLINYIRHKKNKGAIKNFFWTFGQCSGKYIAICEGDDYWSDRNKLEKQVNFMEHNNNYSLCYHPCINVDIRVSSVEELLKQKKQWLYRPRTATLLFPKIYINNMPEIIKEVPNGDTALRTYLKYCGKTKLLPDIKPSVRRIHGTNLMGILSVKDKLPRRIATLEVLSLYFKETHIEKHINEKLNMHYVTQNIYEIRETKGLDKFKKMFIYLIQAKKNNALRYYIKNLIINR